MRAGEDRTLVDVVEVIGDPVDQIMAKATKVFFAHVAQFGRERGLGIHGGNLTENRSYRTIRLILVSSKRSRAPALAIPGASQSPLIDAAGPEPRHPD